MAAEAEQHHFLSARTTPAASPEEHKPAANVTDQEREQAHLTMFGP